MNQWDVFLAPYKQAIDELKIKLKGIRKQYEREGKSSPIEFVTGRVKPIPSIIEKANKRGIQFDKLSEEMYDIAGLRMMCQFVDDIDIVVELLKNRKDFEVVLYLATTAEDKALVSHVHNPGCHPARGRATRRSDRAHGSHQKSSRRPDHRQARSGRPEAWRARRKIRVLDTIE